MPASAIPQIHPDLPLMRIAPQTGPQTLFLRCSADITIYGGAAGGGKSWGLLIEALYYISRVKGFGALILRRTYPEITVEGSLWDDSRNIYGAITDPTGQHLIATPREGDLTWTFHPYGNTVSFGHLEYEKDVSKYHGAQIAYLGFDQLESFTAHQFWYLISRNRSMCGVRPYTKATCNPDPDSWLAKFIEWWIDQETGYPIPERAGVLRWMVRHHDDIIWADSPEELIKEYPEARPLSVTFIPARVEDNPALLEKDPSYLAKLEALAHVERMRLRYGNWKVRATAGMVFQRSWFELVEGVPSGIRTVRYWDQAATEPNAENPDPDYTVGLLYGVKDGIFYVMDVERFRARSGDVEGRTLHTARVDGYGTDIGFEEEGGSSGKGIIEHYARLLQGYRVFGDRPTGDKVTRAKLPSSAAQHGLIKILRGPWNTAFLAELESFPDGPHDDQVDALSGAHRRISRVAGIPSQGRRFPIRTR